MFTIEKIECKGDSYRAAMDLIKAQGPYKQIGSGVYGRVFGHKDSNMVYKIGDVDDNEGYLSYINQLAKCKEHNPFTPQVHGVRIYRSKDRSYNSTFVVAMERLQPLSRKYWDATSELSSMLRGNNLNSVRAGAGLLGIKLVVPIALKQAIKLLKTAKRKANYANWDLHNGNFMLRGDQLVVTDPLA